MPKLSVALAVAVVSVMMAFALPNLEPEPDLRRPFAYDTSTVDIGSYDTFGKPALYSGALSVSILLVATLSLPAGVGLSLAIAVPTAVLANQHVINFSFLVYHWVLLSGIALYRRRTVVSPRPFGLFPAFLYVLFILAQGLRHDSLYLGFVSFLRAAGLFAAMYLVVPRLTAAEYRRAVLIGVSGAAAACAFILASGLALTSIGRLGSQWRLDSNGLGQSIALPLLFYLDEVLQGRSRLSVWSALVIGVISFVVVLSGSRGVLLSLTIGLLFVVPWGSRRVAVLAVLVPLLAWVFMHLTEDREIGALERVSQTFEARGDDLDDISSGRVRLAALAYRIFQENPAVGVGTGNFQRYSLQWGYLQRNTKEPQGTISHNIALTLLSEQGILGLALYMLWIVGPIRVAAAARRVGERYPAAALVTFTMLGMSYGYNLGPDNGFLLSAGLFAVARRLVRARPAAVSGPLLPRPAMAARPVPSAGSRAGGG